MSILDFKATRTEWLENIESRSDSDRSKRSYEIGIKRWDDYLKTIKQNDSEVLAAFKKENQNPDTYLFLNRYIQWLNKQGIQKATIDLYFAALRSWCAANGVMLFNEYVKRFVQIPKQNKVTKIPLTIEIIRDLVEYSPTKRMKAILLVLLSSGMRISEVLQLKVGDINQTTNPISIKIRAGTTKTREERISYISNEAWEQVKILIEKKEKDDYIFVKKYNTNTTISFEMLFGRLRARCGFLDKYEETDRYHVNVHAFRAYFMTQATKILDGDTAHALIGHRKYLDVYFRLSPQEKATLYHKLEPYITVSEEHRQKHVINEKDRQIMELQSMKDELEKQKAKIRRLELTRK